MQRHAVCAVRVWLRVVALVLVGCGGLAVSTAGARAGGPASFADLMRFGPGIANHPLHVTPSARVRIPQGWPLDVDGTLTCSTCHERLPSSENGAQLHLRGFDGRDPADGEFCVKCHASGTSRSSSAMHWMAVGNAHIKPDSSRSTGPARMLDVESKRCLGCHDGVNAREHANSPFGGGSFVGDRQRAHPVGVQYRSDRRAGTSTPLKPEALLPSEVRLPGGAVSCVSCHNLYAATPHLLTVPIERSELCFTCHDMD